MSLRFVALLIVLALFAALTAAALLDVGYVGVFRTQLQSWGGAQVLTDLVIVCTLAMVWMVGDARTQGINPWPFVMVTLVAGSFGPLSYLALREYKRARTA